jgi:hypothetical protein
LRRWWRQAWPNSTTAERMAVLESWLASGLHAHDLAEAMPWRWFGNRDLPDVDATPLSAEAVLSFGELWQAAGDGPDKASGQWFTPPALIERLLNRWATDWLSDQMPHLAWDGHAITGPLADHHARRLLDRWRSLAVIDPAMGAGDWLCGWFRLHQAVGRALAGVAGEAAPTVAESLQTVHGIDRDEQAVALAEVRLALLTGSLPPTTQLQVGDSLVAADERWPLAAFDVVIGNPPYVSTRRLGDAGNRRDLLDAFGYADDLYAHFIDRGLQALKPGGWLLFIVSDTFRTTITKARLRHLLLANGLHRLEPLPADAFAATVATVALTVRRQPPGALVDVPPYGPIPLSDLRLGPRDVLVDPSPWHRERLRELRPHWELLLQSWGEILQNARRQQDAASAIARHRLDLKPGDWSLLGLLCDGGVGLQTGDNGSRLAVRADREAGQAALQRQAELQQAWRGDRRLADLLPVSAAFEDQLAALLAHVPPARLGLRRGEVWRVVDPALIADPVAWPEDWRLHGVPGDPVWVPYEKGDPQGRRWVHGNPFLIRWDRAAVTALRQSGRGRGEPVLRNPQFFFRPGVTWSNMSSHSLKARLQPPCVFDVGSMTLFPAVAWLDPLVLLAWLNAAATTVIIKAYLNHTLNFQINDLRLLPIRVPTAPVAAALRQLAAEAVQRGPGAAAGDLETRITTLVGSCYGPEWAALAGPKP